MKGLIVIPFIDCLGETNQAALDALMQLDERADLLLIDQGSSEQGREWAEGFASRGTSYGDRIRLWCHNPPLPSLAATWNRALDYAWDCGYADAMVWNNDIRVAPDMYARLRDLAVHHGLWFISPVNCAKQPDPTVWMQLPDMHVLTAAANPGSLGGPDFSCYLITQGCHDRYRFDERFQPAYHEDGDFHRRMWLGGDGGKIAGVTLPYLHYGSRTINRSPEAGAAFAPQFANCRAKYVAKWGGEPHHERKIVPDSQEDLDGVGTPGGYLREHLKMPEGYATIVYPKHSGVIRSVDGPD